MSSSSHGILLPNSTREIIVSRGQQYRPVNTLCCRGEAETTLNLQHIVPIKVPTTKTTLQQLYQFVPVLGPKWLSEGLALTLDQIRSELSFFGLRRENGHRKLRCLVQCKTVGYTVACQLQTAGFMIHRFINHVSHSKVRRFVLHHLILTENLFTEPLPLTTWNTKIIMPLMWHTCW